MHCKPAHQVFEDRGGKRQKTQAGQKGPAAPVLPAAAAAGAAAAGAGETYCVLLAMQDYCSQVLVTRNCIWLALRLLPGPVANAMPTPTVQGSHLQLQRLHPRA